MNYCCEPRVDGFGAQFQTIIQGIVITETDGNNYIHTPMKNMAHNYDNDPLFLSKIEDLMNIKNYYLKDSEKDSLKFINPHVFIEKFESNIDYYIESPSMKKIKTIFKKNKINYFINNYENKINVAVHIRRPNINDNRVSGTDTPNKYFINIMNKIREKYKNSNKPLLFHIYSQGNECDFECYVNNDVIFHINKDLFNTFTELVYADILVMSASSFSYSAALLSDNEIYYHMFWHKPYKNWITITDDCP
jgi:hypothetical protein